MSKDIHARIGWYLFATLFEHSIYIFDPLWQHLKFSNSIICYLHFYSFLYCTKSIFNLLPLDIAELRSKSTRLIIDSRFNLFWSGMSRGCLHMSASCSSSVRRTRHWDAVIKTCSLTLSSPVQVSDDGDIPRLSICTQTFEDFDVSATLHTWGDTFGEVRVLLYPHKDLNGPHVFQLPVRICGRHLTKETFVFQHKVAAHKNNVSGMCLKHVGKMYGPKKMLVKCL